MIGTRKGERREGGKEKEGETGDWAGEEGGQGDKDLGMGKVGRGGTRMEEGGKGK